MKTGKDLLTEFLFELQIINPIEIIIRELEAKKFTDNDLDFLNKKFESFMNLAAKTLGVKIDLGMPKGDNSPTRMNEYAYNYYTKYFKTLLTYFKEFHK